MEIIGQVLILFDKKMLMSMHAGFLEGSPADREAHLKLLKSMVEDNLGKVRKN